MRVCHNPRAAHAQGPPVLSCSSTQSAAEKITRRSRVRGAMTFVQTRMCVCAAASVECVERQSVHFLADDRVICKACAQQADGHLCQFYPLPPCCTGAHWLHLSLCCQEARRTSSQLRSDTHTSGACRSRRSHSGLNAGRPPRSRRYSGCPRKTASRRNDSSPDAISASSTSCARSAGSASSASPSIVSNCAATAAAASASSVSRGGAARRQRNWRSRLVWLACRVAELIHSNWGLCLTEAPCPASQGVGAQHRRSTSGKGPGRNPWTAGREALSRRNKESGRLARRGANHLSLYAAFHKLSARAALPKQRPGQQLRQQGTRKNNRHSISKRHCVQAGAVKPLSLFSASPFHYAASSNSTGALS